MLGALFSRLKRLNWRIVLLALFCVGILHIGVTISASQFRSHPGYSALANTLPLHDMTVLAPITPDYQPHPFMSPSVRYALCRYDTSNATVEISAILPDSTWTLSLHTPQGENIFTATGQDQGSEIFTVKLIPSPERFSGLTPEAQGTSREITSELTVVAQNGIAILRGPIKGLAYQQAIEDTLIKANCRTLPNGA